MRGLALWELLLKKLKIILRSQSLRGQDEGPRDLWNPVALGKRELARAN